MRCFASSLKVISAAAGLSITVLSSGAAIASTCVPAIAPTVPATYSDEASAFATRDSVMAYFDTAGDYMECLESDRVALGESITAQETETIDNAQAASEAEQQTVAETWNTSFGGFLAANQ